MYNNIIHKKSVMLDLETLSTDTDATLLSIAAIDFYPFEPIDIEHPKPVDNFFYLIDLDSQIGRSINDDTVAWWGKQDQKIQDLMFAEGGRIPLEDMLTKLAKFVCNKDRIYSQGSFDINILEHAYKSFNMPNPWAYYRIRDSRTLLDLAQIDLYPATHDPLDDCNRQVLGVKQILNKLNITSFSR